MKIEALLNAFANTLALVMENEGQATLIADFSGHAPITITITSANFVASESEEVFSAVFDSDLNVKPQTNKKPVGNA